MAYYDNYMANRFHYDHIDMFDKTDSICKMIKDGTDMTAIYEEINKCQLLCISCHIVVLF